MLCPLHLISWVRFKCISFKGDPSEVLAVIISGIQSWASNKRLVLRNSVETSVRRKAETTKPQGCHNSHELVWLQKNNHQPYYFVSISLKPQVFKIIALSPNIPFLKKISALLRCTWHRNKRLLVLRPSHFHQRAHPGGLHSNINGPHYWTVLNHLKMVKTEGWCYLSFATIFLSEERAPVAHKPSIRLWKPGSGSRQVRCSFNPSWVVGPSDSWIKL